jgi:cephalosporin hydroxylase
MFPRRLPTSQSRELDEIRLLAAHQSDIDEHLELMFAETLLLRPNLIVELGVREGASTFVFERAAARCSATLVSVDLDDCSVVSQYPKWHFFRGDDVDLAAHFHELCRVRNIAASVDLLFIDTSHYYDHTVREIQAWFPLLSPRAKVMFHDTNMRLAGRRKDGCFQLSWNNQRGVIRAIEEQLTTKIDETKEGVEYTNGWLVRHIPSCNGLTILDRVDL